MSRYANLLESVGKTPLIGLPSLAPHRRARLWAKLEDRNPTGSTKDRAALWMIRAAEESGRLRRGSTILEPTSGNTGIALAMIARQRGYKMLVVMPENTSDARLALLRAHGAEFLFTSAEGGSNEAVAKARELAAERDDLLLLNQYANEANAAAHYDTTGPELLDDLPEITHLVAGLGTAGTLVGTGRYLKEKVPGLRVVAAEPAAGERMCGLRNLGEGFVPELFDEQYIDERRLVTVAEAQHCVREALVAEGLFVGVSAGAALHVALQVADEVTADGGTADIAVIIPDGGWKYLTCGAYEPEECEEH